MDATKINDQSVEFSWKFGNAYVEGGREWVIVVVVGPGPL